MLLAFKPQKYPNDSYEKKYFTAHIAIKAWAQIT
jgi:hypothetical protein